MKTKFILLLCIINIVFSSCSELMNLQKRKYRSGYYVDFASSGNSKSKSLLENCVDKNTLNDTLPLKNGSQQFDSNGPKIINEYFQVKAAIYSRHLYNELTLIEKGTPIQIKNHFYEPIFLIKTIDGDTSKTGKKKNRFQLARKRPDLSHDEKIKGARTGTLVTLIMAAVFLLLAGIAQATANVGIAVLCGLLASGELLIGIILLIYLLFLLHQKKNGTIPDENDSKVKLHERKVLMWLLIAAYIFILISIIPAVYYLALFAMILGFIALMYRKNKKIKSVLAVLAALGAIILAVVIGYNNTLPKSQ